MARPTRLSLSTLESTSAKNREDGTAGLVLMVPRVICLFERPPWNKLLIGEQ